jgi:hypothetical protein
LAALEVAVRQKPATYADLGQIAMKTGQRGWYLSLHGRL